MWRWKMNDLTPETLEWWKTNAGEWKRMCEEAWIQRDLLRADVASLTARLETARRLERYAHHIDGCETGQMATDHCDCGLSDLFAALAAEEGI
jgi:hypothetical protein